jgi:hypothetical protein
VITPGIRILSSGILIRCQSSHSCSWRGDGEDVSLRRQIIFVRRRRLDIGCAIGERTRPETFALFQTVQPRRRVGDEARLGHLAVADDVEAGIDLLAHAIFHRAAYPFRIGLLIDRVAVHARQHQLEQIVRARQAADMGGQDAFGAALLFLIPAG